MAPSSISRQGVVAVICRNDSLLAIRRADGVEAPGALCFPGGAIESGESEHTALIRELHEELDIAVTPVRCVWRSTTPWNVALAWWSATVEPAAVITPNPAEVADYGWYHPQRLLEDATLLSSNVAFLHALNRNELELAVS